MTLMHKEACQTPAVVQKQWQEYGNILGKIIPAIQKFDPQFVLTVGRGSSDHAANFAKYLFETKLGLVTASSAPSINTLYKSKLNLKNALVLAFSQSGQSSDIVEVISQANKAGALTLAFVNDVNSPLAKTAQLVVPLFAGEEKAVAATKSYIATLFAICSCVARMSQDKALLSKLAMLPEYMTEVISLDWSSASEHFSKCQNALVLGRGYSFPIALEAALKFKETCKIHAEAFSSAEVLHGPFALMEQDFSLMVFGQNDETLPGLVELLDKLKQLKTTTFLALPSDHCTNQIANKVSFVLPTIPSLHPICDPLFEVLSFYLMVEHCAKLRGINPDQPDNIKKVTDTL